MFFAAGHAELADMRHRKNIIPPLPALDKARFIGYI